MLIEKCSPQNQAPGVAGVVITNSNMALHRYLVMVVPAFALPSFFLFFIFIFVQNVAVNCSESHEKECDTSERLLAENANEHSQRILHSFSLKCIPI